MVNLLAYKLPTICENDHWNKIIWTYFIIEWNMEYSLTWQSVCNLQTHLKYIYICILCDVQAWFYREIDIKLIAARLFKGQLVCLELINFTEYITKIFV